MSRVCAPDDGVPSTSESEPTTSTTSTTADATTSGGPACGDGHLDPGEDCDLGPENANDGACTMMCDPAVCGDGLLWTGREECDFGAENVGGHGGCNSDCTWGPRCGDGKFDAGFEECDLGALNGTGMGLEDAASCGATCRWQTGEFLFGERSWTNTSPFGEPFSAVDHCAGWTSGSNLFVARVGLNALEIEAGPAWQIWHDERHWTSALSIVCDLQWRLYCFEDGYTED